MPRRATLNTPTTQKYLSISEIRDNCVVLKDGTLRAVLLVSSINFALKSEDEQNAIVSSYVSFLNSIDAPLQIVIHSRKLDLEKYLVEIKESEDGQENELLKLQTAEYRQYITDLVELGDIMTKRFYLVISYDPASDKRRGFWRRTGDVLSPTKVLGVSQKQFEQMHEVLFLRVDKMLSGLSSMGLRSTILDTQSLIELYYNIYNPVVSQTQKIEDISKLRLEED